MVVCTKYRPSFFLPIAAFIAAFFLTAPAQSKVGLCIPTDKMMESVRVAKMQIVFRGISDRNHLVTVYINEEAVFLAITHHHNYMSCIADKGTGGEKLDVNKVHLYNSAQPK